MGEEEGKKKGLGRLAGLNQTAKEDLKTNLNVKSSGNAWGTG